VTVRYVHNWWGYTHTGVRTNISGIGIRLIAATYYAPTVPHAHCTKRSEKLYYLGAELSRV